MQLDDLTIGNIKKNLFYRSIDAISDYNRFDWHKDKCGMIDTGQNNSSQALAIDFWGCLKLSKYKNELINKLFVETENDWDIQFEYVDKKLLSEKKSTQIDILIRSKNTAIFIESKFTEQDGGGCSQVKKTKNGIVQCSGNYITQINPKNKISSKCALTGKEIKYWCYIDQLTCYKKDHDYRPCPFRNGEYQWMRNICFAEAYARTNGVNAKTYLAYLESKKCPISKKVNKQKYLGKLKDNIINTNSFMPISYNNLLETCISFLSIDEQEKKDWTDLEKWIMFKESLL